MDIPIFCSFDELKKPDELNEHPLNPNKHPEGQARRLADVIRRNGWRNAIVVSRLSGYIIKGHGRLAAARAGGFEVVPVVFQDYATPADEAADLVADNLIAEESEVDIEAVNALAAEFDLEAERLGQLQGDDVYASTRLGKDEGKADADKVRKVPIMILVSEEEADKFDAVKARLGAKDDETAFSEIFKGYLARAKTEVANG